MRRNSLIIRFIDIALTVLFGFVGVSEIQLKTQIKLPNKLAPSTPSQMQPKTMSVRILEGPLYWLGQGEETVFLTDQQDKLEKRLVDEFKATLEEERRNFVALIEPDPESPIQLTIDLIDICKRNSIPQNINYLGNAPSRN